MADNLYIGTSGFTSAGWSGTFFPRKMPARDYLSYYATRFNTVELMSTLYGPPTISTVKVWYSKTPSDFIFAVKMPRTITHQTALLRRSSDISNFFRAMDQLKEKLGPMLVKFGSKDKALFASPGDFLSRFVLLLKDLPNSYRFALSAPAEWITRPFVDALRIRHVALVINDFSFSEKTDFSLGPADLTTSDFHYVRWVGEAGSIRHNAKVWDRMILNRIAAMPRWAEFIRKDLLPHGKVFAYATNEYEGHAPSTAESFQRLLKGGIAENLNQATSQTSFFQ